MPIGSEPQITDALAVIHREAVIPVEVIERNFELFVDIARISRVYCGAQGQPGGVADKPPYQRRRQRCSARANHGPL